jgi:hypothetical protein
VFGNIVSESMSEASNVLSDILEHLEAVLIANG